MKRRAKKKATTTSRRLTVKEIARIFDVPLRLLPKHLERSSGARTMADCIYRSMFLAIEKAQAAHLRRILYGDGNGRPMGILRAHTRPVRTTAPKRKQP